MKINKNIVKIITISVVLSNLSMNAFAININWKESNSFKAISSIGSSQNSEKTVSALSNEDIWETGYANMPTARDSLTIASVNDKIYAIGGCGLTNVLNTVEEYDPTTDKWSTKTPMPTVRDSLSSAVLDGKIYVIGGWNSGINTYYNRVEVYDPATDTWETKTPMPTSRYGLTSVAVDGKIYSIGGFTASGRTNVVEVYDPVTDTWETKSPMPTTRSSLTGVAIGGKIYCVGGWNSSGTVLSTLEVYDPKTDTWETKKSMSVARVFLGGVVVANKLYAIGGYDRVSRLDVVEEYDPVTDTWTTKASMVRGRSSFGCSVVNGRIYCAGGRSSVATENTMEAYLPKTSNVIEADSKVLVAEMTKDPIDIENARDAVNKLPDSADKEALQDRLNAIVIPSEPLMPESSTVNADVYIKPQNVLSLTLDTNNIVFEDFNGAEDLEKLGAINLTVNSSLPYELNVYLASNIENSDKTATIGKEILNLKTNNQSEYKTFVAIGATPIKLLDNQQAGVSNEHSIDIKLKASILPKADVYKTAIKFEVKQK